MKNSENITHLPPIIHRISNLAIKNDHDQSLQLDFKQDKPYLKPHLQRIAYPPYSEKREKENTHQILVQSCISNRRYEDLFDEERENKIKNQLGPSLEGSSKILESMSYIGREAPLKHYKQYKRLEKTLLRKDYNDSTASLIRDPVKQPLVNESPSVSLLEKAEALRVLPLCMGLVKCKGEPNILNLTNYNLGDRYIIALAAGLKNAKTIEKCLLGANRITDVGLSELVRSISPEILVLDLSQNKITQVDKRLLQMIIESEYKLQEINLANNLLKMASAQSIFRNIRYSKHIKNINLSKNKLTAACLDSLAEMIEKSTTLEQLYIGTNYLSGKAGQRIFNSLSGNKVLKVFDYSLNQLGDSGELACAKAIANCFKTNKTLQHIDISFNNFGKEATEIISEGIQPNKHLYGFHYRGNYGWVNSKGFLILQEKQETLLDSIDQQKMNGFEVTVIRQNHSFKSEPIKNVCWICEGWHQQQFRLTLPKQQGKLFVYIHFDFQKYQPRLISQNELHVRYITMVPPKKYRYFFTHNQEVYLDSVAQTQDLPLSEVHSYQFDQVIQEIHVDKISYRTSKSKKIVDQANQIAVKTLPRFNGLVARRIKEPWAYGLSLWAKEWKLDDEQLLKKCFERDWKQSKIMNLIKNQADQDKVRGLLWANYESIKAVYKQFASWSPFGDIWAVSNQPFTQFCQQAKIINKETPLKITDLTFITTNSMSGSDWKGNNLVPERGLVRFQFMESLVRLAQQKFKKNGIFDNFSDSVQALLSDHLKPLSFQYNTAQWRLQKYFTQYNDILIKNYRPIFSAIYRRNSKLKVRPGEKAFMCLAEFRSILQRCGLNNYVSERDSLVSFNCSMITQVDELESERFIKMTEIEFIEAIARIANCLPKQCCIEPDEAAPLHMRLQWVIQQLKPLCPEDIRSQYPQVTNTFFRLSQLQEQ